MDVTRTYANCIFTSATIREALAVLESLGADLETPWIRNIETGTDSWGFDDDDEFFAAYEAGFGHADYGVRTKGPNSFRINAYRWSNSPTRTNVDVTASARGEIERVLRVFGDRVASARIPEPPPPAPPPPTIFIGHGHSQQWRDLKDHLHEQHGYAVEAYETGARAGHAIRDILEGMMATSSFAVLVMTAEDAQPDGTFRTRQNVVHEAGLFQGCLGFDRAIVAIEEGVEPFSNLQGVDQIGFSRGNIREIFGDVLATLRREFPGQPAG